MPIRKGWIDTRIRRFWTICSSSRIYQHQTDVNRVTPRRRLKVLAWHMDLYIGRMHAVEKARATVLGAHSSGQFLVAFGQFKWLSVGLRISKFGEVISSDAHGAS